MTPEEVKKLKPGDIVYIQPCDLSPDQHEPTLEGMIIPAVCILGHNGRLLRVRIDSDGFTQQGGVRAVPFGDCDEDVSLSPGDALRKAAARERDYGEACIRWANFLEQEAAKLEGRR